MVDLLLRTEDLPPKERFEFWHETVQQSIVPIEVRSEHTADFRARMRVVDLGAVQVSHVTHPSLVAHRTARLIRASDPDLLHFGLNLRGHVDMSQGSIDHRLEAGGLVLYDNSHPYRMAAHGKGDRHAGVMLAFPRTLLPLRAAEVEKLRMVPLPGSHGLGRLISRHVRELAKGSSHYRPADGTRLATVTLDLVAALLAHHVEADSRMPPESHQRVLLARIHAFIHEHLGDPGLSPDVIAAANRVSTRTLHRLFRANDATVAGWIRARRLDRCRRDLGDPALRTRPVHAIATRWGFPDPAQFSRAFKAAYGISPLACRVRLQATAREQSEDGAQCQAPGTDRQ
ncbi:helix-turn-helix domain-containing protein [Streptomyces sp. LARHCF249]